MKDFYEYEQNEDGAVDIPIGETFAYKDVTLKVILDNGNCCKACYFVPDDDYPCGCFACASSERKDEKSVIFEKVKE